jgi:hypothetical protein
MITIHTEEILKINEGTCPPDVLKEFMKDCPNVSVGVYRDGKIIQLLTQSDIMNDKPSVKVTLVHSQSVLDEARHLFFSFTETPYCSIPVVDEQGNYIYYLSNEPNQVDSQNYVSTFESYDIHDSHIDFELVSRGDVFLFSVFEEYTCQIARIILENFPDKHVFFLDGIAHKFFQTTDRCHIISGMNDLWAQYKNLLGKSIFYVSSEKDFHFNNGKLIYKTYCSLEIMTSLFWSCDIISFGEEHPDKTFYLIKNRLGTSGLADMVKFTLFRVAMVSEKAEHYIPVIDFSLPEDNQFTHGDGRNAWTLLFDQVSDIPLEEVYRSKNVIISHDHLELFNPYVREYDYFINWSSMFKQYLKINSTTQQYVEKLYLSVIPQNKKRILGVIGRGTDYNSSKARWVQRPMNHADFVAQVNQIYTMGGYDSVFLGTEDAQIFDLFQNSPLKNVLCYVEQERIDYSDSKNNDLLISEIRSRDHSDGYQDTLRYFGIIYILAKCTSLVSNVICGGTQMAKALNDGAYESVIIF